MVSDDVIYGSITLHVTGELSSSYCTIVDSSGFGLNEKEAREFVEKGYCLVEKAADGTAIDSARQYIDAWYLRWLAQSKRQDDWRMHFQLDLTNLDSDYKENGPILNLLLHSPEILGRIHDLMGPIGGLFYTQVAFRTPMQASMRNSDRPDYSVGAEYHLDGQANASGERFPDHWTVMVGIALVDILTEDKGNFTVFGGSHTSRDWRPYPDEKRTRTLPSLENIHKVCLRRGDAIFCHVLLAHRGGKNTLIPIERDAESPVHFIQTETREMVFFRIKQLDYDYNTASRSEAVLADPWFEHKQLFEKFDALV